MYDGAQPLAGLRIFNGGAEIFILIFLILFATILDIIPIYQLIDFKVDSRIALHKELDRICNMYMK